MNESQHNVPGIDENSTVCTWLYEKIHLFKMHFDSSLLFYYLPVALALHWVCLHHFVCVCTGVYYSSDDDVFWQYPAVLVSSCGFDRVSSLSLCCVFIQLHVGVKVSGSLRFDGLLVPLSSFVFPCFYLCLSPPPLSTLPETQMADG